MTLGLLPKPQFPLFTKVLSNPKYQNHTYYRSADK